jgi:hypothetical protein
MIENNVFYLQQAAAEEEDILKSFYSARKKNVAD